MIALIRTKLTLLNESQLKTLQFYRSADLQTTTGNPDIKNIIEPNFLFETCFREEIKRGS